MSAANAVPAVVPVVTVSEFAPRIRKDPATVRRWCAQQLVPGAVKHGRDWHIPAEVAARIEKEGITLQRAG